jgi:hypothetical protein
LALRGAWSSVSPATGDARSLGWNKKIELYGSVFVRGTLEHSLHERATEAEPVVVTMDNSKLQRFRLGLEGV